MRQAVNKLATDSKPGGSQVSKSKMIYFEEEDILHIVFSGEKEMNSVEVSPNVTAELNERGELIGIEILEASSFIRDSILETVQAKMLNLTRAV
jgi:uncharacterized protein YuzE